MQSKKLYRNTKDKVLTGVCAGIAEYFSIDVTIIRLLMVIFAFAGATGVLFYIIASFIIPDKPTRDIDQRT